MIFIVAGMSWLFIILVMDVVNIKDFIVFLIEVFFEESVVDLLDFILE